VLVADDGHQRRRQRAKQDNQAHYGRRRVGQQQLPQLAGPLGHRGRVIVRELLFGQLHVIAIAEARLHRAEMVNNGKNG